MPKFEAQVWVSGEHPYETEINAANVFQARKNIARREGVDEKYVNRVFEIRESSSSSSSSSSLFSSSSDGDVGGYLILGAILFGIWLIVEYWWIVVPVAVIIGILAYIGSKE